MDGAVWSILFDELVPGISRSCSATNFWQILGLRNSQHCNQCALRHERDIGAQIDKRGLLDIELLSSQPLSLLGRHRACTLHAVTFERVNPDVASQDYTHHVTLQYDGDNKVVTITR